MFCLEGFLGLSSNISTPFPVFLQKFTLGRKSFKIGFAPDLDDIKWSCLGLRTFQTLKNVCSTICWILSLTLVINSDRLANFVETYMYSEPGDNAFTNFLDKYQILRVSFNLAIAEIWALIIGLLWRWGYWTGTFYITKMILVSYSNHQHCQPSKFRLINYFFI
jgi:hypothetical protein